LNYSTLSNEELLSRYRDLDKKAFDEFFRRNNRMIFSFLATRLRNNSEAEEVLQDTFFRIHKYVLKYDTSQNAMSWSFTIAKNCALDLIAKRKKIAEIKDGVEIQLTMDSIDTKFQIKATDQLVELLEKLSEEDRSLIKDRFINDKSYEDLAKVHGISPAGVRQRISRLFRKLREES